MAKIITNQIIEEIERLSEPSKMTKEEAMEWYEEIKDELDTRIECLREEIAND